MEIESQLFMLLEYLFDLINGDIEVFFAAIYFVDSLLVKVVMQFGFKLVGILAENQCVNIKFKRN